MIKINIDADEDAFRSMLDNATQEEYINCDVTINGVTVNEAGIRPKGNSSLNMVASGGSSDRFSFKIEFDHFIKGQTLLGLDKLALNNMTGDATYMKEYLSYEGRKA
ncbi:MAG: CotH kinase family protein [Eubacteriales bacterium]|nr:CotH kinase family protein [Eubacteriales bacterium]